MPSNWIVTPGRVPSTGHAARARERQATLTKPAGSLGRLEQLAIDLAGLQHNDCPSASRAEIIVFAGALQRDRWWHALESSDSTTPCRRECKLDFVVVEVWFSGLSHCL